MDVLIVTTPSHSELAERFFRPTLPAAAEAVVLEKRLDVAGAGTFESRSWQTGVTGKLRYALEYLDSHPSDAVFVLSDVDIQFFPRFSAAALGGLLDNSGLDVLFQKESKSTSSIEVNTGFYVAKSSPWLRSMLDDAIKVCDSTGVHDQTAINSILDPAELHRRWGHLPLIYYARSQGFPPPTDILLHHANLTGSVEEKAGQLHRVRKYVTGGIVDKIVATVQEAVAFVATGKLRLLARIKVEEFKERRRSPSRSELNHASEA